MKKINRILLPILTAVPLVPTCATLASCKDNRATYTVTLVNGQEQAELIQVKQGDLLSEPTPKTKPGENYTFGGWYQDTEFTYKFDFTTPVLHDMTLYAKWTLFDGRVSEGEWNSAIDYLLTKTENTNYSLTTEATIWTQSHNSTIYVDGFNELFDDFTTGSHSYSWAIGKKNQEWVDHYHYNFNSLVRDIRKSSYTGEYKRLKDWFNYNSIFKILSISAPNQPYSYNSSCWTYDKDGHLYFTTIVVDDIWYDVTLRFDPSKRIDQFSMFGKQHPEETGQIYSFSTIKYDPVTVTLPSLPQKKQKCGWYVMDDATKGVLSGSQKGLVDYDSPTAVVSLKNETNNPVNYKITVDVTNNAYEAETLDNQILEYTGTIAANETIDVTIDFRTSTKPIWKDIKCIGIVIGRYILSIVE